LLLSEMRSMPGQTGETNDVATLRGTHPAQSQAYRAAPKEQQGNARLGAASGAITDAP
jgi:hypothetical protein